MTKNQGTYHPQLNSVLDVLGIVSAFGVLMSVVLLFHNQTFYTNDVVLIYLLWFGVSWLSVVMMQKGDPVGAYALGLATVMVTIHDFAMQRATLGGAILGITVMVVVISYVMSNKKTTDQEVSVTL